MGFNASNPPVEELDYDFTKDKHGRDLVKGCKGITPEPTEDQVYNFQFAMRDAAKTLGQGDLDPNDQAAVMEFMDKLTREDMKKVNETIFGALAELTSGQPSKAEMMELSAKAYRLGQAYMGSLMGSIMDPKTG